MAHALDLLRKLLAKLFFLRLLPGLLPDGTHGLFLGQSRSGLTDLAA